MNMGGVFRKLMEACGCRKKKQPLNRTIYVGNQLPETPQPVIKETFCPNRVVSSKYTVVNFLPKNLFEQFQRIANFYFLFVGFIELLIDSPVSPVASLLPLFFVVSTTAVKQGYEDYLRHKADNEVNHREVFVVRDGKLQVIRAMKIQVGDIVRVQMNHGIPCDMVMLSSENAEGECYITTANLDGETNLKTFSCLPDTRHLQTVESFADFRAVIKCQQPITDLYKFVGTLIVPQDGSQVERSLNAENVLLRGSRLKNTSFIFGCAVYTGQETKISLNSRPTSCKFSRIEKAMNKFLIVFLVLLLVEASILTGLKHLWYSDIKHRAPDPDHDAAGMVWYGIPEMEFSVLTVLEDLLAFMVLLNYIIPISMYVTVEIQKFLGSMFFQWDSEMYDVVTNEAAKSNTSDLNEELGQVEYLFTDKTGTLTENDMQFRQCSVGGVKYVEFGGMLCIKPDIPDCQPVPVLTLNEDLQMLLQALVLCHTVRVECNGQMASTGYSENGTNYEYQASSPDEKALLEACRRYGTVYHGVRDDLMEVTVKGVTRRYVQHHVLDFDPVRKMMSVIVEDEAGDCYMFSKGAEMAILDRVTDGNKELMEKHVTDYAMEGLRTLVIGYRKLTKEEFSHYDTMLKEARTSLDNREQQVADAMREIETDLTLLGATAVEDKLQEGVPETITALREAGIQVWVLTGDKEETAVNVSYSAGHFYKGILELRLTRQKNISESGTALQQLLTIVEDRKVYDVEKYALIIDGRSLAFCLEAYTDELRRVCEKVETVLCCRMSPIQKAQVVRLIKESKKNPTTAAIGDGANDVSMILEAHVGLGVMGKEGRQAVRSSDYAFGKFRFIKKALLVHGHYYYIRLATLVQYFFYKNIAFITANFYLQFYAAFSAQALFETFCLTLYNVTFTALPILIYGLFEQHVSQQQLMAKPHLYKCIRGNARLSIIEFIKWNVLGFYQSAVFFFGVWATFYYEGAFNSEVKMAGLYDFGAIVYTVCIISVNLKLMLEWYHWNVFTVLSFVLTIAFYFASAIVYNYFMWPLLMAEYSLFGTFNNILSSLTVWLNMLLVVVAANLPDILIRASRDTFNPLYRMTHRQRTSKVFPPVTLLKMNSVGDRANAVSQLDLVTNSRFSSQDEISMHM